MSYAVISLGGKQYRVREGERLLVDQLKTDEGKTFEPRVLLIGGDGKTDGSSGTSSARRSASASTRSARATGSTTATAAA
jgi:ribosomal protein L21